MVLIASDAIAIHDDPAMLTALPGAGLRAVRGLLSTAPHAAAWALDYGVHGDPKIHRLDSVRAMPDRLPRADEVFLWSGTVRSEGYERLVSCLSDSERGRLEQLRRTADRASFAAAHAVKRALLAAATQRSPLDLRFAVGPRGKPGLDPVVHGKDADRLHFNISHSDGLAVVALAGCPVGVDVERVGALADANILADAVFPVESGCALAGCPPGVARTALFYRLWTLSEAFAKATGAGMTDGFQTFAFAPEGAPRLLRADGALHPPERWRFGVFP